MYHSFGIHSLTDVHLGCFKHVAIANCAAMNIGVHRYFEFVFQDSEGIIPAVELPGQKAVPFIVFLRKFHNVFHGGCTSPHFHQQCTRDSYSPQPQQYLLLIDLLMMAFLTSVKWYLTVVLICSPLLATDAHISCVWALCMSSLEKCLFRSSAHYFLKILLIYL